jgi:ATP/maltotriose-dependent transcriptional regulator MalT
VSNQEDKDQTTTLGLEAYSRLETAVEGTLAKVSSLEGDLDQARSKVRETEELLRKFSAGEDDPASLNSRRLELEGENKDLLEKLRQGREGVERLLARIRFLEEQG